MEGRIEMAGTSREGGNWTLAFPYILQCEACFPPGNTASCARREHLLENGKNRNECVCVVCVNFFYCAHMCSSEYPCVS